MTTVKVKILLLLCLFGGWAYAGPGGGDFIPQVFNTIKFTENSGQVIDLDGQPCPDVLFTVNSPEGHVYIRKSGFSFVFTKFPEGYDFQDLLASEKLGSPELFRLDIDLQNANPNCEVIPEEPLNYISRFISPDGEWVARNFNRLIFKEVYPGIDMKVYTWNGKIKYDFWLAPGADPGQIKLEIKGADEIGTEAGKDLFIKGPIGLVTEEIPRCYQPGGQEVSGSYRVDSNLVSFALGPYDPSLPLVIDPVRQWATYFGGNNTDYFRGGVAVDANGNIAVAGYNLVSGFPTTAGAFQTVHGGVWDAFLVKFDASGAVLWATYYGGAGLDIGEGGCAVDAAGNIFFQGWTTSLNLPMGASPYQGVFGGNVDVFIAGFRPNGTLLWSTYLGSTGEDRGRGGICTDPSGNVIVAGETRGPFPVTAGTMQTVLGGIDDAYVTKFSPAGVLLYSTYVGGNNREEGTGGIVSDALGNIYLHGSTLSNNFPVSPGAYRTTPIGARDAYLVKLKPDLTRRWATYFGGTSNEEATGGIALDGNANIVFQGTTTSNNLPGTAGKYQPALSGGLDSYIGKFDSSGTFLWATYLGGTDSEYGNNGIATDQGGRMLVSGYTNSTNFPTTPTAFSNSLAGGIDLFMTVLSPNGAGLWSTYYGGTANDGALTSMQRAYCTAYDQGINAVVGGFTASNDFPVTPGAAQGTFGGGGVDGFLLKFCMIDAQLNSTDLACFEDSSGAVDLEMTGSTAPFSFLWSNGAITEDISGLAAGPYSVTVTDITGCVFSGNVLITQPPLLTASVSGTSVDCFGDSTGTAQVIGAGGSGALNYLWSTGDTVSNLNNLPSATYTVTVTDSLGCVALDSTLISQPPKLMGSFTSVSILCRGESTGSIDFTPAGGTPPYSFSWSNGAITEDISNLAAGTFILTLMDSLGCLYLDSVTLTQPGSTLGDSAVLTHILCNGDSTGNIDLSVFGATPPYSYLWSTGDTTQDLSSLPAGIFTVTITDFNGCQLLDTFQLTEPAAIFVSILAQDPLVFGDSNGFIDLTVGGGVAPYVYAWSNGEISQDIDSLPSGTYSFSITDGNGCIYQDTIFLVDPPVLTDSIAGQNIACRGDTTGAVQLFVAGGRVPYTFLWNTGDTTQNISDLLPGTYSVIVTDSVGTQVFDTVTLTQPATVLWDSLSRTDVFCYGDLTGEVFLTVSGATPPYSYLWSNGAITQNLIGVAANLYSVTITDAQGCILRDTIDLPAPAVFVDTLHATSLACFGDTTGSVWVDIYGGSPPYQIIWATGDTVDSLFGLPGGNYALVIIDSLGCDLQDSIDVFEPGFLDPEPLAIDVACFGDSSGMVLGIINGGTAPFSYIWSTGDTTQNIFGLFPGSYSLVVTDANGCNGGDSAQVSQPLAPLSGIINPVNILCNGDSTGSATLNVGGGRLPYQYLWSTGDTLASANNLPAGTYSVLVTDSGACILADTVVLTEPAALNLSFSNQNVFCFGDSSGIGSAIVTGGTGGYDYLWSTGDTLDTVTGLVAGSYFLAVMDSNGCSISDSINLTEPQELISSVTWVDVLCFGLNTGSVDLSISGGVVPYNYLWSNGAISEDLTGVAAGQYSAIVTDSNGCTVNDTATLIQPAQALFINPQVDSVVCFGENNGSIFLLTSGGSAPYSYSWAAGDTTQGIDSLFAGAYAVTLTDSQGCQLIDTIQVDEPNPLAITFLTQNVSCNGLGNGAIDLSVAGGTQPWTYNWSTGDTTQDITGLNPGVYSVIVIDSNGCSITDSITVIQPAPLGNTLFPVHVLCYGQNTGGVFQTVQGGSSPYTFLWSNGATTSGLTGVTAGTYSVTVTDAMGCTFVDSATISQPASPFSGSALVTGISCFGDSTGTINYTLSGGVGPYNLLWNTGDTITSLSNLAGGLYILEAQDNNYCVLRDTIEIISPQQLVVSATFQGIACYGDSNAYVNLQIGGGTLPYSFAWNTGDTLYSISNLGPGTYYYLLTDSLGCTLADTFAFPEPSLLTNSIFGVDILCYGDATGQIQLPVSGGTPPYTFSWNNGATTQNLQNLVAGYYYVTIRDSNGCGHQDDITLFQSPELILNLFGDTLLCNGDTANDFWVGASGGVPAYSWSWSTGSVDTVVFSLTEGDYWVSVTDSNQCVLMDSFTIRSGSVIQPDLGPDRDICAGDSVLLDAGPGYLNYLWNTQDTTPIIYALTPGLYFVKVQDSSGCRASDLVLVSVRPQPVVTLGPDVTACEGAVVSLAGPLAQGNRYLWNTGDTTSVIHVSASGIYILETYNQFGCTAFDTAIVTLFPAPDLSLGGDTLICEGGAIVLDAGPGYSQYIWSNGGDSRSVVISQDEVLFVIVIDTNNCSATSGMINVSFVPLPATPQLIKEDNVLSSSSGPFYQWFFEGSPLLGQSQSSFVPGTTGYYSVMVTDSIGCRAFSDSIYIIVNVLDGMIPEGISPNGDGLNDYWVLDGLEFFPEAELIIFNRWGNEVYRKRNYFNDWNGTNGKGEPLPDGNYFYLLDLKNGLPPMNGVVLIVR